MRLLIFSLASLSFACLLGEMYGLWSMRWFGCFVLVPATGVLVWIALRYRRELPARWIVEGALAGILAALAYDLYRLPFVMNGGPLFQVFPKFGELLCGATGPRWLVHTVGWSYHFSNGAALGIMFLSLLARPTGRRLFWGAIAWALVVELLLLLTSYPAFFGFARNRTFFELTLSAHLVFGIVLGLWCRQRAPLLAGMPK